MPKKFKPIIDGNKLLVQGRVSYEHLMEPAAMKDQTEKFYSCALLIDKSDRESVDAVNAAIDNAIKEGLSTKWSNKMPRKFDRPLRDGAEKEGPEYQGKVFFNCKARRAPAVLDRTKKPILVREEVYSGMYAILAVTFYPYNTAGNNGVGVGLDAVLKVADGEQLSGGGDGASRFEGIEIPDNDDVDDIV